MTAEPLPLPTDLTHDNVLNHSNGSQNNPLDLIECDLVVATVVEFGRTRTLMRGRLLRVFE
jgi:hypothetical protein